MEEKKKIPVLNIIILILVLLSLGLNGFIGYKVLMQDKKIEPVDSKDVDVEAGKSYTDEELVDIIMDSLDKGRNEGYEDAKKEIKDLVESGRGVNTAIREVLDDYIFYIHGNEYIFKPINKELPLNKLKYEKFIVNERDLPTYTISYKDSEIKSYKGIDVSKFQGDIDWEKVAADGVEFAFVRVGYRGYETAKLVEDDNCKTNIENALKNNIKTGVYFYTQAINEKEAIEEANFVIDIIKDYDINYPVAFDLEMVGDDTARTNNLTADERVKIVKAFCDTIKEAGYTPMLYGNLATMFSMVEYEEVTEYEKWFAYYDIELYFPYELAIWQYSCTGNVDGINGNCDLNIAFKDLSTK